ncbi:MAG TPA: hypothetical protein DD624_04925 [Alphaproteobacteria bacterium]|mgnify:FL=1|nr:hypothetical protein [Alphaproteobacteria bacterium]
MNCPSPDQIRHAIAKLKQDHAALDETIRALQNAPSGDEIQIQRLKKRKLALKDEIQRLENLLLPDIIA